MTELPEAFVSRCAELSIEQTESILCVSIDEQLLHWFKQGQLFKYVISCPKK